MMEKLPKQVYTAEFRQQAVELITRDGLSIAAASRRLSISPKTLANWVKWDKEGTLPKTSAGTPRQVVTDEEAELSWLRRENAELRMERDILKKCMAPPPGSSAARTMSHEAGRMQQVYPASVVWEFKTPEP